MRLKNNNKAVTHIMGFLLMFVLSTTLLASTVYVTDNYIDSRTRVAARVQAEDIASTVADALLDVASYKNSEPDSSYERIINVPPDLGGRQYYVELARDKIYVKSVDGQISEEFITYNTDEYGFEISGKAYGDSGKIRLYCTATQDIASFDFDTDASPTGYGYYHVGLSEYQDNKCFDVGDGKSRKYKMPITIDNTDPPEPVIKSALYAPETAKELSDYPVLVRLGPSFLFDLCEDDGADILFREVDESGNIVDSLPFWIEEWDNDPVIGSARIWVKILEEYPVLAGETKTIHMYFGYTDPANPDPETDDYKGSDIFDLFEDFEDGNFNCQRWALLPLTEDPVFVKDVDPDDSEDYILHMPYPSYLFAGPKYFYFEPPLDPDPADEEYPRQRKYKVLFIDAKIRVDSNEAEDRPGQTIIFGQGVAPELVGYGFPGYTLITMSDESTRAIENIKVGDTVKSCKFDTSRNWEGYVDKPVTDVIKIPQSLVPGDTGLGSELLGGGDAGDYYKKLTSASSGREVQCTHNHNFFPKFHYQTSFSGYQWKPIENLADGDKIAVYYQSGIEYESITKPDGNPYRSSDYTYELKIQEDATGGGCYFAGDFLVQSTWKDASALETFPHTEYYYVNFYDIVDGESSIPEPGTRAILINQMTALGSGEPSEDSSEEVEISAWTHELQMAVAVKESVWIDGGPEPEDWDYDIIQGARYSYDSGAEFATAGIKKGEIETDKVFLGGYYGFSYLDPAAAQASLGGGEVPDRFLDIDWIKIQEMIFPEPRIYPGGVEGAFYGWDSKAAPIPIAVVRTEPTVLFRDFHINDAGSGVFTIAPLEKWVGADELDERCTIRITFGDNDYAHDDIRVDIDVTNSEDGSGYVTYFSNIDTDAGEFVTKWAKIEVDTKEKIKIKIIDENHPSNPADEKGWPLCRLILETGYGGVHLEAG